jgi:serine/threonine protein kinase
MRQYGRTALTGDLGSEAEPTRAGHARAVTCTEDRAEDRADDERIAGLLPHGPVELVAEGGMALVYRGHDVERGTPVAIKVLRCSLTGHAEITAAFTAEHAIVSRIAHPGVIATHGADEVEGVPYLVMDWCDGQTLADVVAFEPMALRRAAVVGARLAAALDAVHRAGVIHCDVKPANILIASHGDGVRLLDFGVARLAGSDADTSDLVAGTPSYMAPEQWSGAAVPASDVYSLGCVLYELVTGAPPFQGSFVEVMRGHRDVAPPPITELRPDAPAPLGALIMSMLAKVPDDRPTMAEVAGRLAPLVGPRMGQRVPGLAGQVEAPAQAARSLAA